MLYPTQNKIEENKATRKIIIIIKQGIPKLLDAGISSELGHDLLHTKPLKAGQREGLCWPQGKHRALQREQNAFRIREQAVVSLSAFNSRSTVKVTGGS